MRAVRRWSIVTPEYPPGSGGIGDYTELVARRLAERGDRVSVFTRSPSSRVENPGVEVVLLPDDFGRATQRLLASAWARSDADSVVLVQYVPQGFRKRGMNVPFCAWLGARPERRFLMLHEALYAFSLSDAPHRWLLAAATRLMLRALVPGAERLFLSTPGWESFVERWGGARQHPEWLPIPATLAADPESLLVDASAPSVPEPVVCHFGTYGELITAELEPVFSALLARRPDLGVRLLGRGADRFERRLAELVPSAANRIRALAREPRGIAEELARASAVLLPFSEGVTSRRTSLMNALAVGAAIVTTEGIYSERLWRQSGGVSLYPAGRPELAIPAIERLLDDPTAREAQRRAGLSLYRERFALDRVVDRLQALHDARARAVATPEPLG